MTPIIPNQHPSADTPLGPFDTSSEALLALRPEHGSYVGPDALFDLLKSTMDAAGVALGAWDWRLLRWLAGQDAQTVAAIAGWVGRAGGEDDDLDGLEPYCAECGSGSPCSSTSTAAGTTSRATRHPAEAAS